MLDKLTSIYYVSYEKQKFDNLVSDFFSDEKVLIFLLLMPLELDQGVGGKL